MATFVVDNIADENDGDTSAGHLSLREAIGLANADPDHDTIVFAAALSDQTITLGSELALTSDITINGDVNGDHKADIAISGNDTTRILNISGSPYVSLESLTLTNGH